MINDLIVGHKVFADSLRQNKILEVKILQYSPTNPDGVWMDEVLFRLVGVLVGPVSV